MERKFKQKEEIFIYVYKLMDSKREIIYIGKTIDIKKRMYSHFYSGHLSDECYNQTKEIEYVELNCEMDMILLEIILINKYKPKYNERIVYDSENSFFLSKEYDLKWRTVKLEGERKKEGKGEIKTNIIRVKLYDVLKKKRITVSELSEMTGLEQSLIRKIAYNDSNGLRRAPIGVICKALEINSLNEIMEIK